MRTRSVLAVVAALIALLSLAACGKDDKPALPATGTTSTANTGSRAVVLHATLAGGTTEVPDPGDADGKGSATVRIDAEKGEVCYTIAVQSIAVPAASHIHEGAAGGAGPVVITFDPTKIGTGESCLEGQPKADLDRIVANPAGFYVNVHTADFPGGAVRGQLAK